MKLNGSVGKMGQNKAGDIALLQEAFRHVKIKTRTGTKPLWQKKTDGRNSKELEQAIACFQLVNNIKPTGKLDSFGAAMNALQRTVPYSVQQTQLANTTTNPPRTEIDRELSRLASIHNIPIRALKALISAESDFRQFDSFGNLLVNVNPGSSAVGLGQITRTTANLYGKNYTRLSLDWRYNLEVAVIVFKAGYTHPWNRGISDLRIRAARAYGMYHDGFEPRQDRQMYSRHPRGLTNSSWERRYLSRY